MHKIPGQVESAAVKAARELSESLDPNLVLETGLTLQQELTKLPISIDSDRAAHLLEANEQLVIAMLQAQADVEAATLALIDMTRFSELDLLTELPNRTVLHNRVERAISHAQRHGERLALLYLNLDNFKQINTTLGHAVGDEVLKLVARCLLATVRESDTVSRHGGDEFLILLTDIPQISDAIQVANAVLTTLSLATRVAGHVLRLSASIGISIYPDNGETAETLIARADEAMCRTKRLGLRVGFATNGDNSSCDSLGDSLDGSHSLKSLQQPLARYEGVIAAQEIKHAQLQEANEQLVLAALTAQELQAAAEQKERQQTEFLAVVAHELRNPLTPIRNAAALLGRVKADDLPMMRIIIERQVTHMTRLIGDLLDVARVNTGKLRLEHRVVNLAVIIDETISACRSVMDTRLQNFQIKTFSSQLQVYGDPIRLRQIFTNVLDNASKYTPEGGKIKLAVVAHGDTVVITVTDNGIGITAEALPSIFNPFMQDTHAIGFNGSGLGIGLTVVRELVEAHGGTVTANSAGKALGSTFIITLPLSERIVAPH